MNLFIKAKNVIEQTSIYWINIYNAHSCGNLKHNICANASFTWKKTTFDVKYLLCNKTQFDYLDQAKNSLNNYLKQLGQAEWKCTPLFVSHIVHVGQAWQMIPPHTTECNILFQLSHQGSNWLSEYIQARTTDLEQQQLLG